jgi:predicted site-specific integrase-resolvase
MTAAEYVDAAYLRARFGVSAQTLARWATDGRIGRSQPGGPGTAVRYRLSDVRELFAANETPRRVALVKTSIEDSHTGDWRSLEFWRRAK